MKCPKCQFDNPADMMVPRLLVNYGRQWECNEVDQKMEVKQGKKESE